MTFPFSCRRAIVSRLGCIALLLAGGIVGDATLWAQPGPQQSPYPPRSAYPPAGVHDGRLDPYATISQTSYLAAPLGNFRGGFAGGVLQPVAGTVAERLWLRAEYLHWWTDGLDLPPLVTTSPSGTAQAEAAVLGFPATETLFGGGEINEGGTSGLRVRSGLWLTPAAAFGIEGEFFMLAEQDDGFRRSGGNNDIVGRPFFDVTNDRDTSQLISFPGLVEGDVRVDTESRLRSYLVNGRAGLCPTCGGACGCPTRDRVDWVIGYRRLELDDRLDISENLNSLITGQPGTIALQDSFRTRNDFNGLQLGIIHQANFRRTWLESMLRVAVGNNSQRATIRGNSAITEFGVTENFEGGLLAQRSNIGVHERDQFVLIPEIGFTLGVRITDWLDATIGYTVLYYPNVIRAGDQIDTDLNPNLLPEEADPFSGSLRPRFRFIQSDYLAHGISFGGELTF